MKSLKLAKILFFLLIKAQIALGATDPAFSGSWYDPAYAGAGFLIEVLPGDRALVYWFTYNDSGEQQWFVGVGDASENRIDVDEMLITAGGQFGDAFDPDAVERIVSGHATFEFTGCNSASVDFVINGQAARQSLTRLTGIQGLPCGGAGADSGANWQNHSGSWFNTDRSGEGFIVELLDHDLALVDWFTYDPDGNQAWLTGVGHVSGTYIHIDEMLITRGGRFGPEHDPAAVELINWGSLELNLACGNGSVSYDAVNPAYGSNARPLSRLTSLAGIDCAEDSFHRATATELRGAWQSDGFGLVAIVGAANFSIMQVTSSSCIEVLAGPSAGFEQVQNGPIVNEQLDKAIIFGLDAVTPVYFNRTASVPPQCRNGGTAPSNDPFFNFEAFWDTYNELYAFFPERNVDWAQRRAAFEPQVRAGMPEVDLFNIFAQMLDPLDDGHVSIKTSQWYFNTNAEPEFIELYNRAFHPGVDRLIEQVYLANQHRFALNNVIKYGLINPTTGYFNMSSMQGFIPGADTATELEFLKTELDRVFSYFAQQGVDHLILDIRKNTGGDSTYSRELAGRFYRGRSRLVYSERRPTPNGLSEVYAVEVNPSTGVGFDGEISLLTSALTASAAEIFTLAIRALPHATLVGGPTAGVLSRTERVLPNGWIVSITEGYVETPAGERFEVIGIPVDVAAETFPLSDRSNNRDSGIEAALAAFGS